MGAELISRTVRAKNIQDAWNKIVEDANDYSGHQEGYSGDFNSCTFEKDVTSKLKEMSQEKLDDYIEEQIYRGYAWGYCIKEPVENKNKVKSTVSITPQVGSRKWKTIYKAIELRTGSVIATDISQTDCIKKARAHVEKEQSFYGIRIEISKLLEEGNKECARISYKPSKTEALGLYKFIGLARS